MRELMRKRGIVCLELLDGKIERPSLFEPGIAARYKREVKRLIESLNSSEHREEAFELLRSMIEAIVLTPSEERGMPIIDLVGDLAGILSVASGRDKPALTVGLSEFNPDECEALVAGVGFEPTTFRL
tara:strand:+ start:43 stop:426 length:384 start_codon:yes stop_codon:yes gene_type:complete